MDTNVLRLYQRDESLKYYNDLFSDGYMEGWPADKLRRVFELIRELRLPERGTALDFGCGNGVFTDIIKRALPAWDVYGTDISPVAIENAKARVPGCNFFTLTDRQQSDARFDFLFTHHVLEHVWNLQETWGEMMGFLKPASRMLHLLPCGNPGSFEYEICLLRKDGINSELEGRFFFEDPGHVRRLNTAQVNSLASRHGFQLSQEYYSYQFYGAIRWITEHHTFVLGLTDPSGAKDAPSRRKLHRLRLALLLINLLRKPALVFLHIQQKKKRTLRDYLLASIALPLCAASYPANEIIGWLAEREWATDKLQRNGSEMYLFYTREAKTGAA